MSASADMVQRAYEDVRHPQVWVRPKKPTLPHYEAALLQLMQSNAISKQEAMERMVFAD